MDVSAWSGLRLDIRYATADNFMKKNVYDSYRVCWLHEIAAAKLEVALYVLRERRPEWSMIIYDALRPRRVQRVMWSLVEGTPNQKYVANPERGSLHNYGFAVDINLANEMGEPLDMGTRFDEFTPLSEPQWEEKYLASGELSAQQVENRTELRLIMQRAGFKGISSEWWHFDALPGGEVRGNYTIIE